MLNIFLHITVICIIFYYVYINGTDYDRPLYQSANEIHYYFYKKTADSKQSIKDYENNYNKSEKQHDEINKIKAICEMCDEKTGSDKTQCRENNKCDHYETIENFANKEDFLNYNTNYDKDVNTEKTFNSKTIFIEFKIIFLMVICILLASHQHYGIGGNFSIQNLFKDFTGGVENLIFLCYLIALLVFLYSELKTLYGDNKKK
jgi:hypothetical protein